MEADFLNCIADAAFFKRYYININGAPIQEVIFWETLISLEASRTFINSDNILINKELSKKYEKTHKKSIINNPRLSLKYTALNFTIISYLIDKYIIGNKIIDIMPRWLVYPVVKYLLYFEYLIQSFFPSNKKNNIFLKRKKVKRISSWDKNAKSAKARSIRAEVMKNRIPISNIFSEDKVREQLKTGL